VISITRISNTPHGSTYPAKRSGLKGPSPRAVVPLPARRGELRAVPILGERRRRRVLCPRRRVHLRRARHRPPCPDGASRSRGNGFL